MDLTSQFEVPVWIFVFLTVCLLFISIVVHFLRQKNINEDAQREIECLSPDCIRCSNPHNILKKAQKKLSAISPSLGKMESDIAITLAKDIEDSLNNIYPDCKYSGSLQRYRTPKASSPKVLFIRGLREKSIFSPSELPGLQILVKNYSKIKLEFYHLYKSPLKETKSLWKVNTTESGTWEIVHLINQGSLTRASELCPITMSLLRQIPSIMDKNVFGNIAFSVVHPHTLIERHCGSTNCRIRCHLGLQVPLDCCCLMVDGVTHKWKEAELLCFNDAYPHSVSYMGSGETDKRVVLMVDVWHPDVSKVQREMIDIAFSFQK